MCAPGFAVSVIDSPGFSNVLFDGACSRIRLLITLDSAGLIALARGGSMAFVTDLVM